MSSFPKMLQREKMMEIARKHISLAPSYPRAYCIYHSTKEQTQTVYFDAIFINLKHMN